MLPAAHRMRRSPDFDRAVRRGCRAGRRTLVVHVVRTDAASQEREDAATRVGFVVSRSVGSAVVRNRVKRRLRALTAARVEKLPSGLLVVVRALPPAGAAPFAVLAADLDAGLARALVREAGGTGSSGRPGGGQ